MKSFYLFILLSFPLLAGFQTYYPSAYAQEKSAIAQKLLNKAGKKLETKYSLELIGTGMGIPEGKLHSLKLVFQVFEPLSIEAAREKIVNCSMEFLEIIQKEERLHECMVNYPFRYKNIKIGLIIHNYNGDNLYTLNISNVSLNNNLIIYASSEDRKNSPIIFLHEETVEEALEILKNQTNDPHP